MLPLLETLAHRPGEVVRELVVGHTPKQAGIHAVLSALGDRVRVKLEEN